MDHFQDTVDKEATRYFEILFFKEEVEYLYRSKFVPVS